MPPHDKQPTASDTLRAAFAEAPRGEMVRHHAAFQENRTYEAMIVLRQRDPAAYKELSVASRLGLGFYEADRERAAAAAPAEPKPYNVDGVDTLDDVLDRASTLDEGELNTSHPLYQRALEIRRAQGES